MAPEFETLLSLLRGSMAGTTRSCSMQHEAHPASLVKVRRVEVIIYEPELRLDYSMVYSCRRPCSQAIFIFYICHWMDRPQLV
jgi:hypothetical protein